MLNQPDSPAPSAPVRVAIGIASRGRPSILEQTLKHLAQQTRPAECVLVAYLEHADIAGVAEKHPHVLFLQGSGGSCAQRNHLLDAIGDHFDLVLFLDDDFYLHRDYMLRLTEAFALVPDALGATGTVIADGAKGPGLTVADAQSRLAAIGSVPSLAEQPPEDTFNTYGCNMAFRVAALRNYGIRFDENLPAYGWYEDLDFSRRLLPYGRLLCIPGALGVHLGVKLGRTSGKRFGYSQVANPMYLARKGSYPWFRASSSVARNFVANAFGSVRPEAYIDRRGRLLGNLLALLDGFRGRIHPTRILTLH